MTNEEKLELWKKASDAYYNSDEPIMEDMEFDMLTDELKEAGYDLDKFIMMKQGLVDVSDQDSSNIGLQVSLKKIKWKDRSTIAEILKFFRKFPRNNFYAAPKFDGCSLKIVESDGTIMTRGGQDVTDKIKNNPTVVKSKYTIKTKTGYIVGELLMPKKQFNEKYSEDFSNARNIVSGALNRKDISLEIIHDLVFVAYTDGMNPIFDNNVWIKIPELSVSGLLGSEFDLTKFIEYLKSDDFPFLADGIVIATPTEKREIVDNYPTNMVAIKFPSEIATTKVIDIEWSQKKTSKLTPTLITEPVNIQNTRVHRCAGNNYAWLRDRGIGIGSVIKITKSGDIIPHCVGVLSKGTIKMPEIDYKIIGKNLIASEDNIETKQSKFYNAIRRLGIKGIGDVLSNIIAEESDYDIFKIFDKNRKIDYLSKLGPDSANWKIFSQVYEIKTLRLSDVIFMCQFNGVGDKFSEKISLVISKKSTDVSNLSDYIINNVCRGEGFQKIKNSMYELISYGVSVVLDSVTDENTITFEMTGEPPGMTKEQYVALITKKFPQMKHISLKKDTNLVITNNKASNSGKMTKARKYNIKIVTYNETLLPTFNPSSLLS